MLHAGVAESKGKRPYMEDRHIIAHKLPTFSAFSLFGIFDGHGGSKAAESIKELIVPTIETHIHKGKLMNLSATEERAQAMKVVLHTSILEVDNLFGSIIANGGRGGSTAIVALIWGDGGSSNYGLFTNSISSGDYTNRGNGSGNSPDSNNNNNSKPVILAVANVGDCRGILIREDGMLEILSIDHKPNLPSERERIEKMGGRVITEPNNVPRVEGILAVSRAIGDISLKPYVIPDPEITLTTLQPNLHKVLVMASDGVWDVLTNEEVAQQVRLTLAMLRGDPDKAAHEVVRVVLQRGGIDNMTCLVVAMNWDQAQS